MRKVVFVWCCPWNDDKVTIYSDSSVTIEDMMTGEIKGYKFGSVDEASDEIGKMYY